jgi:von Willebrand factor type A domain
MKRATPFLGAILCLAVVTPAVASESFILNIPVRGIPNQETGEVRIALGLSAAPAGAQLVVNGNTTLNLGDTVMAAGDSVSFAAGTGNEARITYKPLSNFGVDFCAGGNAVEKNISMRFSGAQDVTDFRVATYVVASPMVECSAASKHTGDTPANLIPMADGVAPALSAIDKGRNTFDVVLVLDKSGSMADFPPGAAAGATKIEILKSAVQAFVGDWEQLDQPTMSGAEWSHDRLGLVFFDSTPAPQTLAGADPPANFFVQRGGAGSSAWDAVINDSATLTPGSSTSIGGGINEAMKQWKADPKSDLSLVVVTDGMQNTAPLILPTASGFLGLAPISGLPQELRKRFIPIQTIGFGTPASVDQTLLTNIAFETSGVSFIDVNATTMFNTFAATLVALLKGNTASLAIQRNDTLNGPGPSADHQVLVDHSAQRVVFSLQWAPPLVNALELEVFRPGTSVAAPPTSAKKLPQAAIQTFNLGPGDAGPWRVRVKRAPNARVSPVPYTLNVFFLEKHLDFQLSLDTPHAVAGDKLGIRAVVDWDGKRLAGLPPGSIRVRVQRPAEGLGTILHNTRVDVSAKPKPGDTPTALEAKLQSLGVGRVQPKDFATIVLEEQKAGVYAGTFDQTSIPGQYGYEVVLDWDIERTGHVHREERLEQLVTVKADPGKSEVTTTRDPGGLVQIAVTPRDRFGNYLGPGYASVVKATVAGPGKLRSDVPVDRNQTGTYVFTLADVPAEQTPKVGIVVDGVVLR